jgi:hypothetical protein
VKDFLRKAAGAGATIHDLRTVVSLLGSNPESRLATLAKAWGIEAELPTLRMDPSKLKAQVRQSLAAHHVPLDAGLKGFLAEVSQQSTLTEASRFVASLRTDPRAQVAAEAQRLGISEPKLALDHASFFTALAPTFTTARVLVDDDLKKFVQEAADTGLTVSQLQTALSQLSASPDLPAALKRRYIELPGVTLREAMRTTTLWALALGSFCLWFSITAVNSQVTIFFEQEAGLAIRQATLLYSLVLGFSVVGKFAFGWLADHRSKQQVMILASLVMLAGCLLLFEFPTGELALTTNVQQLALFTFVYGLGFGGAFTMIQLVCVASFGQRELGKILGLVIFIDTIGAVLGIAGIGFLKDYTGTYVVPFAIVVMMAVIGAINMWFVRPLDFRNPAPMARVPA